MSEQESAEAVMRRALEAVLACETYHNERGHAFLAVPARSLNDLANQIRFMLDAYPALSALAGSSPQPDTTTEDQARPLHPSGSSGPDQAASETVPMSARQKELIAWGLRGGKDLVAPTQTQEKKADTESDQAADIRTIDITVIRLQEMISQPAPLAPSERVAQAKAKVFEAVTGCTSWAAGINEEESSEPSAKRMITAVDDLILTVSQAQDAQLAAARNNELKAAVQLSLILSNGNASEWDEIFHAAESLRLQIEAQDARISVLEAARDGYKAAWENQVDLNCAFIAKDKLAAAARLLPAPPSDPTP